MKKIKYLIIAIILLFIAWTIISYIDIISDNCHPNPKHSKYNLFTIVTNNYNDDTYKDIGIIENRTESGVIIKTSDGATWFFEAEKNNFITGERCIITFNKSDSKKIDDEIIKVEKRG